MTLKAIHITAYGDTPLPDLGNGEPYYDAIWYERTGGVDETHAITLGTEEDIQWLREDGYQARWALPGQYLNSEGDDIYVTFLGRVVALKAIHIVVKDDVEENVFGEAFYDAIWYEVEDGKDVTHAVMLGTDEDIKALRAAGCQATWAHPGQYTNVQGDDVYVTIAGGVIVLDKED